MVYITGKSQLFPYGESRRKRRDSPRLLLASSAIRRPKRPTPSALSLRPLQAFEHDLWDPDPATPSTGQLRSPHTQLDLLPHPLNTRPSETPLPQAPKKVQWSTSDCAQPSLFVAFDDTTVLPDANSDLLSPRNRVDGLFGHDSFCSNPRSEYNA
jgi:hypothetical protein